MVTMSDILHGRILIVDDQEPNVLLLEQMLRSGGYDAISSTRDPAKVCEMHLLNCYDLILLDLQMPGMDGFQVMENLKEIETGGYVPVLVITAQSDHKLRALQSGAKDFISKPFDLAEVLSRVHNMLEVRLLHMEALQLYDRIVAEQKVSKRLLLGLLPHSLAEILQGSPDAKPESSAGGLTGSSAEVAMLFADLVAFTGFAEGADAGVLKGVLNALSASFETAAVQPALERGRTMDDVYLAAVGLPDAKADQTVRAADKGLDLREAVDRFNGHSRYKLKLRIGVGGAGTRKDRKTM
jgi:adenylate cyclase